jgi:hypothetical protein
MRDDQKWLELLNADDQKNKNAQPLEVEAHLVRQAFLERNKLLIFQTTKSDFDKILKQASNDGLLKSDSQMQKYLEKVYSFLSAPQAVATTICAALLLFVGNVYQFNRFDASDYDSVRSVSVNTIIQQSEQPRELMREIENELINDGFSFQLIVHSSKKYEFQISSNAQIQVLFKKFKIEVSDTGKVSVIIFKK